MLTKKVSYFIVSLMVLYPSISNASGKISGKLKTHSDGDQVVVITSAGDSTTCDVNTSGRFSCTLPGTGANSKLARLTIINSEGTVAGYVYSKNCSNKGKFACSSNKFRSVFRTGDLGNISYNSAGYYLISSKNYGQYTTKVSTKGSPIALADLATANNLGYTATSGTMKIRRVSSLANDSVDIDNDGAAGKFDTDNDNDGVFDNYDSTVNGATTQSLVTATELTIFSNLKIAMESTINYSAIPTLTTAQIDSALQSIQTLAIQVAGNSGLGETTELDCSGLNYCSSGGTGTIAVGGQPFPGTAGGTYDADSDGLGEMTIGSTGDFQLKTGATTSEITAGDTLIERVTDSAGKETVVPGMLNFVFSTTPAINTISVNGAAAQTVNYTTTPRLGSSQNCISAPASGDISVTIVAWPPQRPGISSAGEGAVVDIGGSRIVMDIPNPPCVFSGGGGCSGTLSENCTGGFSSLGTGLTTDGDGLLDGNADQDNSTSNTRTFTVNLSTCLGSQAWNSGETLFVDLQFLSKYGDNAAQKFCITRQ